MRQVGTLADLAPRYFLQVRDVHGKRAMHIFSRISLPAAFALQAFLVPAHAAPATYAIDGSQTSSRLTYRYFGSLTESNGFDRVGGTLRFDPVAEVGAADIEIDAASVNTGDFAVDRLALGEDFFDVDDHPVIRFEARDLPLDGASRRVAGMLTLRGLTRRVVLEIRRFHCAGAAAEVCEAEAALTIRRSDFEMDRHRLLVGDDITLRLNFRAVKTPASGRLAGRDPAR